MDIVYVFDSETKRYAKFQPAAGQPVTGGFYLALDEWRELGKPERVVMALSVETKAAA